MARTQEKLAPAAFEQALGALFVEAPQLVCAEIFGSWAAGTMRAESDVDLLLIIDVANEDQLWEWKQAHLSWRAILELEKAIGREVHVSAMPLAHTIAEARRGSGFLTALYSRPRRPLIASLEAVLPADALEVLRTRALAYIARLEDSGEMDAIHAQRRLELGLVQSLDS